MFMCYENPTDGDGKIECNKSQEYNTSKSIVELAPSAVFNIFWPYAKATKFTRAICPDILNIIHLFYLLFLIMRIIKYYLFSAQ